MIDRYNREEKQSPFSPFLDSPHRTGVPLFSEEAVVNEQKAQAAEVSFSWEREKLRREEGIPSKAQLTPDDEEVKSRISY